MSDTWTATGTENEYQAAPAKPTLTVLAQIRGGMLVRAEWSGVIIQLSDKTLGGMRALGIDIIDDESNYLFKADML